jgi:hypothetical protein
LHVGSSPHGTAARSPVRAAGLSIGRGSGIHCLITFGYWTEQASRFQSVWDELLRSLDFDLAVTDPTIGPAVQ